MGQLYEEQPRYDWERFNDLLHEYRGMLTSFPDMFNMHKVCHGRRSDPVHYSGVLCLVLCKNRRCQLPPSCTRQSVWYTIASELLIFVNILAFKFRWILTYGSDF